VRSRHRPVRPLVLAVGNLAALALAASLRGDADAASSKQAARPNVVVVMTDDQTVESLRVMANVRALLERQGTTFTNNFVTYSLCCPSRSTFLTGQYAHNHTVMGNAPPAGGYDKLEPTHANTLPNWLRSAGYHTVHLGKYLNGYTADDGVPPGWDEWYGAVDPSTYSYYGYTLNENGTLHTYGDAPFHYQTDVYTDKAVDIIGRLAPKRQPFFLWVAYLAPHSGSPRESDDPAGLATPVPAPRHRNAFAAEALPQPPSLNEADVADKPIGVRSRPLLGPTRLAAVRELYQQRLESLLAADEGVARIVAALRRAHELRNTYLLFTSDNGFFHGEHRVPTGKVLLYEPSIRVPLIIRGPGIPHGRTSAAMVANIDLAPTILAIAHATPGRVQDGISILPIARAQAGLPERDLLIERGPEGPAAGQFTAIRTRQYLYAEYANGEQELYDLARDPDELDSRHADPAYASVKAGLAARLARLRTCAGPSCRGSAG
jgi:N-acetylglucosamine-6-sulfatase